MSGFDELPSQWLKRRWITGYELLIMGFKPPSPLL
jgi:hypothetical protein